MNARHAAGAGDPSAARHAHASLPALPPRPADGHKGTFGTVCVIGGQAAAPRVMIGGPAFTATAALRAGAGLAVLAVPAPLMATALSVSPGSTGLALPVDAERRLAPSAVAELLDRSIDGFSSIAIGPGLGADVPQQQIVARLVASCAVPMVIDADAINALAALPEIQRDFRAPAVLTPHPAECRRLASALGLDVDPVDPARRAEAAESIAQRLGCVVVLKGARTVVTDGHRTFLNETGNVALATAGTGDVLTGVIAGFAAQWWEGRASGGRGSSLTLLECAILGALVHGRAADLWAALHGDAGLLAQDLLAILPDAVREYRAGAGSNG